MTTLHRCPTCGAARALVNGACHHCEALPALTRAELAARRRAALSTRASRLVREHTRAARRELRRLERVRADRWRPWGRLALVTAPGLALTAWLTMRAAPDVAATVALVFGAASLAPAVLLQSLTTPPRITAPHPWGAPMASELQVDLEEARAVVATMESVSTDRSLGDCPACGGEAAFSEDRAVCRHCHSPLHPAAEALPWLTDALTAQRGQQQRVRAMTARHQGAAAARLDRILTACAYVLGLVIGGVIALAVMLRHCG